MSDVTLPDKAKLRFGAIENFEDVRTYFETNCETKFTAGLYISRIDCGSVSQNTIGSADFCVSLNLDPQGTIQINCSKIQLTPVDSTS